MEAPYIATLAPGPAEGVALGLCWVDIDLDGHIPTLRHRMRKQKHEPPRPGEPKSGKARRTSRLPPFVLTALRRHRAVQNRERLAPGGAWQDT